MPELPPIVTKAYDFALWRLPRVQDFPRSSRFVLGDRLIATLGFFISSFSAGLA
jgi:endonuclease YncB( thermonuclease family)